MRVVTALDAGPMLAAARTPIGVDETSAELEERLARIGADLLRDAVDRLAAGTATETEQDEAAATYARRLERGESQIDWARGAIMVHNQIRGLHPWPLAAGMLGGERTRLLRSVVLTEAPVDERPGTVCAVGPEGIDVAADPGVVRITWIQLAGRTAMPVAEFLRGHAVHPGDVFLPLAAAV
jgi:methionyl-tRNA formyltransferase